MNPHLADSDFTLYVGDVRDVLATLPAESVHCVVTSPPYWGLRDYGTEGQLGLEPTPAEYVQNMVDVFRQVRRVLRADGTLWLNLGDSYATSGGDDRAGSSDGNVGRGDRPTERRRAGLKPKDMCGIPWRVAFALQDDGWYLRSDIIWAKPNPMPESVTDRPTKAHEYLFLLTKSPRYYFDQEAVREPQQADSLARLGRSDLRQKEGWDDAYFGNPPTRLRRAALPGRDRESHEGFNERWEQKALNGRGRNVRSVWEIATQPYPDAHFATFPEELPRRCILAGTSEHGVCPECGASWEREVERERGDQEAHARPKHLQSAKSGLSLSGNGSEEWAERGATVTTIGWRPTCDCGEEGVIGQPGTQAYPPIPATVLDPFVGSGTTNHVARKHGRRSIGIELNPAYAQLAAQRMSQLSLLA